MNVNEFKIEVFGDERGSLISLEENINIPFQIKRVYYIFDTKERVRRGCHAHKKLEQVLICISGECSILLDDGINRETYVLNSPDRGLYIGNLIWREMFNFSMDCVLLVIANDFYDSEDYIRNYHEFQDEVLRKG